MFAPRRWGKLQGATEFLGVMFWGTAKPQLGTFIGTEGTLRPWAIEIGLCSEVTVCFKGKSLHQGHPDIRSLETPIRHSAV